MNVELIQSYLMPIGAILLFVIGMLIIWYHHQYYKILKMEIRLKYGLKEDK